MARALFTFPAWGVDPSIYDIWNLHVEDGRFLNDQDNLSHGLYVRARMGSQAEVVFRTARAGRIDSYRRRFLPGDRRVASLACKRRTTTTTALSTFPSAPWMFFRTRTIWAGSGSTPKVSDHDKLTRTIRESLALAHSFKPTDQRAIFIFDAQKQLAQFGVISMGLKILLAFIGTVTLGIGGVGLMNIMLVSVTQTDP